MKQNEILASKETQALSDKSRQKMKQKFTQIIREFAKLDSRESNTSQSHSSVRVRRK